MLCPAGQYRGQYDYECEKCYYDKYSDTPGSAACKTCGLVIIILIVSYLSYCLKNRKLLISFSSFVRDSSA